MLCRGTYWMPRPFVTEGRISLIIPCNRPLRAKRETRLHLLGKTNCMQYKLCVPLRLISGTAPVPYPFDSLGLVLKRNTCNSSPLQLGFPRFNFQRSFVRPRDQLRPVKLVEERMEGGEQGTLCTWVYIRQADADAVREEYLMKSTQRVVYCILWHSV